MNQHSTNLTSEQAIQQWLIDKTCEVTGLEANKIDVNQEIISYGVDSSTLMVIAGELGETLNQELPAMIINDYPTISKLAKHLAVDQIN